MKKIKNTIALLLSVCACVCVFALGTLGASALGVAPVTANEGKVTLWIFAGLIALLAVAGIVYFIIQHKNKK